MNKLYAIVAVFILSSCAVPKRASKPEYLTGAWSTKDSASSIERDLTRDQYGAGGKVEVLPMTRALVEAKAVERSKRKMDDEAATKAAVRTDVQRYTMNDTCFQVFIRTQTIGAAYFKYFTLKLKDHNGAMIPLTVTKTGAVEAVPTADDGQGFSFSNITYACAGKSLDLSKTFSVLVSNEISESPPIELTWDIPGPQATR